METKNVNIKKYKFTAYYNKVSWIFTLRKSFYILYINLGCEAGLFNIYIGKTTMELGLLLKQSCEWINYWANLFLQKPVQTVKNGASNHKTFLQRF